MLAGPLTTAAAKSSLACMMLCQLHDWPMFLQPSHQQGMSVAAGMGIHHCQGGGGSPEVPGHPESQGRSGHPAPADPVCHPPAGHCCRG